MEPLHIQVTCRAKWRTSRLPLPSEPRGFCPARFATAGAVWQTLADWCCDKYWRIGQNHVAFVLQGLPRQGRKQTWSHCTSRLPAGPNGAHPGYLCPQNHVVFALPDLPRLVLCGKHWPIGAAITTGGLGRTTWLLSCEVCHGRWLLCGKHWPIGAATNTGRFWTPGPKADMEPLHIQVTCRAKWRTSRLPLPSEPRGFCPARFATAGAVWQTLTSWCCDNYWRIGQNHVAFVLQGLPRQVAVVWQTLAHWCCDKYWQILDARAES